MAEGAAEGMLEDMLLLLASEDMPEEKGHGTRQGRQGSARMLRVCSASVGSRLGDRDQTLQSSPAC